MTGDLVGLLLVGAQLAGAALDLRCPIIRAPSPCACCQIVATAALLACCTASGTATATRATCAINQRALKGCLKGLNGRVGAVKEWKPILKGFRRAPPA